MSSPREEGEDEEVGNSGKLIGGEGVEGVTDMGEEGVVDCSSC